MKFREFSSARISSRVILATKFLSHTHTYRHTDRHFPQIVNRVQDIPKRVNLSKISHRKFARNQYFLKFIKKKIKKGCFNS